MLSLNFLLICNAILKLPLFNSFFHFYELRIFQCLSIFIYLLHSECPPPLPWQQFCILAPANPPILSSMDPVLVSKDSPTSEVHNLLPYHRSTTAMSSEQGAVGLRPRYSRAIHMFEVEMPNICPGFNYETGKF